VSVERLAVIAGASSGIGRAILDALTEEGYRCLVVGLHLPHGHPEELFCRADLSRYADLESACTHVRDRIGELGMPINCAVLNVGGALPRAFADHDTATLLADTTLNLLAPYLLSQTLVPGLRRSDGSSLVFIGSTAGRRGVRFLSSYSAAKAGLRGLTQSLAVELAPDRIRVNCIAPGAVATDTARANRAVLGTLTDHEPEWYEAAMASGTGLSRLVRPAEVASMVAYLCGPASSGVSGQTINVCGTTHMG
jgi:NAD(P)-dependent dehydrogenase (short-subunit alcohol dehydrogenase family)